MQPFALQPIWAFESTARLTRGSLFRLSWLAWAWWCVVPAPMRQRRWRYNVFLQDGWLSVGWRMCLTKRQSAAVRLALVASQHSHVYPSPLIPRRSAACPPTATHTGRQGFGCRGVGGGGQNVRYFARQIMSDRPCRFGVENYNLHWTRNNSKFNKFTNPPLSRQQELKRRILQQIL